MIENVGTLMNTTVYDATSCLVQVVGKPEEQIILLSVLGVLVIIFLFLTVSLAIVNEKFGKYLYQKNLVMDYKKWKIERNIDNR